MTAKQMIKLLEQNGFSMIRQRGSHCFVRNDCNGKTTVVPLHNKELKKGTEHMILKDAGLK